MLNIKQRQLNLKTYYYYYKKALDVESEDVGNDKKIQHDVDYTTSVDEQGNIAMEVETSDQEERRHYHR